MAVSLMGKVIDWKDAGPYLNVLQPIKSLKELIQAGQELVNQGCRYDPEMSYELSTESIVCIFNPQNSPPIILDLQVKYKPFSSKFKRYEEECRKTFETLFTKSSINQ